MLSECNAAEPKTAGFTLIEALVALSIVAVALSSIGALIAGTIRGTKSVEAKFNRLNVASTLMTSLPDRAQLTQGPLAGAIANHPWQIRTAPFVMPNGSLQNSEWLPQSVRVTVQSPSGASIEISTIRLLRRPGA
jgi:general secretion pathway protein I